MCVCMSSVLQSKEYLHQIFIALLDSPFVFCFLLRLSLGTQKRTLEQIVSELEVKKNSLAIDQSCMEEREKLKAHPSGEELIKHAA